MRFFFLLALFWAAWAQAAPLPSAVLEALQQARLPQSSVAVLVQEVGAAEPLISLNAGQAMNPASTMKLLTTYAGLELLSPAYTWKTEAYLSGKLEQGVLHGDLILKGGGDPKVTLDNFWLWLRELRARGLRDIEGNLVLDRTAFELPAYDAAEFDNDPLRAYNVTPDALLLNFNSVRLRYVPEGQKVTLLQEPALAGISLENLIKPSSQGDCNNWDDALALQLKDNTLRISGSYPVACGEHEKRYSLLPHARYVEAVFRDLWRELGGTLRGELRHAATPSSATLFASYTSPPLSDAIRDINKFSNNVMARQLFIALGGALDKPLSPARSEQTVRDWLTQKHLSMPELVLENGAGLSRKERISAHSMASLLQSAAHSPYAAELVASLPILGVDGTAKKRLKDTPAATHAHLKTGTLEGVKTLAGYVQSQDGKNWVVVFFINHANAAAGGKAQDELVRWLQQLGASY